MLELQDIDSSIGCADLEVGLRACKADCTEKKVQNGTAAALIVRQGSLTMNEGTSSRSAGSPRRMYQWRITVATACAGTCGPE